jgi:hypothetical protein
MNKVHGQQECPAILILRPEQAKRYISGIEITVMKENYLTRQL